MVAGGIERARERGRRRGYPTRAVATTPAPALPLGGNPGGTYGAWWSVSATAGRAGGPSMVADGVERVIGVRVKKSIFPTFPRAGRCREDVREGAREDAWEDAREDAGRAAGPPGSVPAARCIKGHVPGRSRQRPRVPGGPAALRQRACGTL